MALGVISMIAGVIALGSVVMATVTSVFFVGVMMVVVGAFEIFIVPIGRAAEGVRYEVVFS